VKLVSVPQKVTRPSGVIDSGEYRYRSTPRSRWSPPSASIIHRLAKPAPSVRAKTMASPSGVHAGQSLRKSSVSRVTSLPSAAEV